MHVIVLSVDRSLKFTPTGMRNRTIPQYIIINNCHNKRQRNSDSLTQPLLVVNWLKTTHPKQRRRPVDTRIKSVGQSNVKYDTIWAAPAKLKKAMFFLSNLDKTIDTDSLSVFLKSKMEVTVLSIFAIKAPNRRHEENMSVAFRVCVPLLDCAKTLWRIQTTRRNNC